MRYIMFMIPAVYTEQPDSEVMPSAEMVEQMMAYNDALAQAGVLVSLDGLHAPATGIRFAFTAQGPQQVEVPREGAVGGYWMLEVDTDEAARDWASKVPAQPGDVIEIRRIQEVEDFPDDVQEVLNKYEL